MVGLGIVLLVEAATGSYGLAGAVSAAYVAAEAGFAILQGRLLDRLGQARVLVAGGAGLQRAVALLCVSVAGGLAGRHDVRPGGRRRRRRCPRPAPASGPAGRTR